MSYRERLTKMEYEDVFLEMRRPDCNLAEYVIKYMPDKDDVKLVLNDSDTVRYFVYTEDDIYIIDIQEYMTMNGEEHADWGLVKIPKSHHDISL